MSYDFKSLTPLKTITVNKSVALRTPIEGDDETIVRTGTIKDINSFYHAVLHGYMKTYGAMTTQERKKAVKSLRASLAGKMNRETWESVDNGKIAKIPFQDNITDIIVNIYRFFSNDPDAKGKDTKKVLQRLSKDSDSRLQFYTLITELIPLKTIVEVTLPQAYSKAEGKTITDTKEIIIDTVIESMNEQKDFKELDEERVKYFNKIMIELLTEVVIRAEKSAYRTFVRGLQSINEEVDEITIGMLSEHIKRDIYFLDGRTRLPLNQNMYENIKYRKSIVILNIDNHYEVIGRLLPGNHIQREFLHDDHLIKRLHTILYYPEQIKEKYPHLTPYFNIPESKSDQDSDDEINKRDKYNDSDGENSEHMYRMYSSSDDESDSEY